MAINITTEIDPICFYFSLIVTVVSIGSNCHCNWIGISFASKDFQNTDRELLLQAQSVENTLDILFDEISQHQASVNGDQVHLD